MIDIKDDRNNLKQVSLLDKIAMDDLIMNL